jgi:hypothetical protein
MSARAARTPIVEIRSTRGETKSPVALTIFLIAYLGLLGFLLLPKGALVEHPGAASTQSR